MKTINQFWVILSVVIISSVMTSLFSLYSFKENLIESRKREIISILTFARSQAQIYVDKYNHNELNREQTESEIINALSAINHGSSYIWSNDNHAIARVHIRPEIIGKFQQSYTMHMELLKDKEFGFIEETNVKPIIEKRMLKINGFTKLPEWNWVIGYGVYMDDIEKDFLNAIIKSIVINLIVITIALLLTLVIHKTQTKR